jgi:hypothetical protein
VSQTPTAARLQHASMDRITVICPGTYKRGIRFMGKLLAPGSKCTSEASLGLAALAKGLHVFSADGARVGDTARIWESNHGR